MNQGLHECGVYGGRLGAIQAEELQDDYGEDLEFLMTVLRKEAKVDGEVGTVTCVCCNIRFSGKGSGGLILECGLRCRVPRPLQHLAAPM